MKFAILINEGPYQHQATDTAFLFCKAALAKGHEIRRVFFYHDGVNNSSSLTEPPQDDRNIVQRWSKLAESTSWTSWSASPPPCAAASRTRTWRRDSASPASDNWSKPASRPTAS
jgi:sulfur relay protein TusD/DsrE